MDKAMVVAMISIILMSSMALSVDVFAVINSRLLLWCVCVERERERERGGERERGDWCWSSGGV